MASRKFHGWNVLYFTSLCFQLTSCTCLSGWLNVTTGGTPATTCYKIYSTLSLTFDGASSYCRTMGGYLARETSSAIHNGLMPNVLAENTAHPHTLFWIGLTDNNTNGHWMWYGGPQLGTYRNFFYFNYAGYPNRRDCGYVTVSNNDFKWYTTSDCNRTYAFICQRNYSAPGLTTTTPRPISCPNGWSGLPAQRWCIKLFTNPVSWTAARMQCRSNFADLVRINTTAKNTFVTNLINANKGVYWIGLNDRAKEHTFVWLDDKTQANFTRWNTGEPNNNQSNENCVTVDANKGDKWNDLDCNIPNRFICEHVPFGVWPPFNINTPGPTVAHTNCGPGWEDVTGSDTCISININTLSWLDAQVECRNRGGDLASVANAQEQTYISARVATFSSSLFWIGANDRDNENGWIWSDGTPFAFFNWDAKQPDNSGNSDCTVMSQTTGKWDDVPCQSRNGYICKKKGKVTLPSLITTTTEPPHLPAGKMWGCPVGWEDFRGSCYKLVQLATGVNQATASSSCSSPSMKGALAAIIDADENQFILSLFPSGIRGFAWIGLQDLVENSFAWIDGTPVQYTNWKHGEPNNFNDEDCVGFKGSDGTWNDVQCSIVTTMYVCKKSKSIIPKAGSDEEQGCTNGSLGYGAQCYSFITSPTNFYNAQKDCRARSHNLGNLATIDSGHLQAFLAAELDILPGNTYWIGLQQSNTAYKWQSNWPVSFTYWGPNHTGNERGTCVGMQHTGLWVDYPCSQTNMSYICESPRTGFTTASTRAPLTNQGKCPTGWAPYGAWCYHVFASNVTGQLSWTEARDFCASQATGGYLVTVTNNATQTWLMNFVSSNNASGNFWIGLSDRDKESSYVWVDGSPFVFSNWKQYEPNNWQNREDCVEWVSPQNYWSDEYCYISKNWICQVPRGSVVTTPKPLPTGAQSSLCPNSSWTMFNNHCYFVSPIVGSTATADWFDARQICISMRADLASITSDDENGLITKLITGSRPPITYWLGLNNLYTDILQWSDQSPVAYVSWGMNEPNNNFGGENCVEMTNTGTWSDDNCGKKMGYICKKWKGNYQPPPFVLPPASGGCPRDFVSIPALSFCYYVGGTTNTTRKNFRDATIACQRMVHKANLASIHSSIEEKFIVTLIANLRTPAWIGFHDETSYNQFEWVDNLPVTYTHWGPGQPDENRDTWYYARTDCVDIELRRNVVGWYDRSCNIPLAYVCEAKKEYSLPTTAPNTTGCHQGYQRYHSSCYKFFKDNYDWLSASSLCKTDGGSLVTINSAAEQSFVEIITGHVNDSLKFWLGLQYNSNTSTFSWQDGWPLWYTNWGQGEPNTKTGMSCVTQTLDGQWHADNCTSKRPFVCEINLSSRPPPTRPTRITANCPKNTWVQYRGNCYHFETSSLKSWSAASTDCILLGGSLASIHSSIEANFVRNLVKNLKHDVWIGLYKDQRTGFAWQDNTELEYLNWETGEPNDPDSTLHQDCGKILSQDGKWADTDCFDENAYLCKITYVINSNQTSSSGNVTNSMQTSNSSGVTNSMQTSNSSGGLSGGGIAGVVIAILLVVTIAGVVGFVVFKRRSQTTPFRKQPPLTSEPGFENASYSTSRGVAVNSSSDA